MTAHTVHVRHFYCGSLRCSCGWRGGYKETEKEADAAFHEHLRRIAWAAQRAQRRLRIFQLRNLFRLTPAVPYLSFR